MTLTAVIPTLNAAATLAATLAALAGVDEVIVVDGGSTDATIEIARESGARLVCAARGRGSQLAAGAAMAQGEWLLFLHADTVLEPGWQRAVMAHAGDPANRERAAAFRFAVDDGSPAARRLERLVAWRSEHMALPYGDQGLLISREFYQALGGFSALPLMEDVELVRRIGRDRLVTLQATARTSAVRWREQGWIRRSLRNLVCLSMYYLGVPPRILQRIYG